MSPERAIAQLARRQHALATYRQLNQVGLNEKQIRLRQQSGQFSLVRPSVVRIAAAPETRHAALLAVCLSADLWGVTRRAGVPTSDSVRLLFDLAADREASSNLEATFDHLNVHHLISGNAMLRALDLRCRPGTRRVTVLRDLVNDRLIGADISDSQLESTFADFVRQ